MTKPPNSSTTANAETAQRRSVPRLISRMNGRARLSEQGRVAEILRKEATGGILLVVAAVFAIVAANSPLADPYFALRDFTIGPESLGLNLSLGAWASDGLLAVFFFLTGLELKREFVTGDLRQIRTAIVPVAAAFGGVVVPALIYAAINWGTPEVRGWAIPTATDIAFAVAVLALLAPRVPPALRMFLLTLAVVDDLVAIIIIALVYTAGLAWVPLVAAIVPLALFFFLAHRFAPWFERATWASWVILLPLGVLTWGLVHESGIHATIAGVLLGFAVPVQGRKDTALAEVFEHRFRPFSSGFAVPVFAFFASGVAFGDATGFPFHPLSLGILTGLVLGKPLGIVVMTWLLVRFTKAELDPSLRWRELVGVSALAGIGFTVSLLITELSFTSPQEADTARVAVMVASIVSIAVAAIFLVRRPTGKGKRLARIENQRSEP
jgi:NhaA family Na+:H+ antiporter